MWSNQNDVFYLASVYCCLRKVFLFKKNLKSINLNHYEFFSPMHFNYVITFFVCKKLHNQVCTTAKLLLAKDAEQFLQFAFERRLTLKILLLYFSIPHSNDDVRESINYRPFIELPEEPIYSTSNRVFPMQNKSIHNIALFLQVPWR